MKIRNRIWEMTGHTQLTIIVQFLMTRGEKMKRESIIHAGFAMFLIENQPIPDHSLLRLFRIR